SPHGPFGGSGMTCPRCQHDNRPAAKFCEECATPLQGLSPSGLLTLPYAEVTGALSEALEQQTATADILRVISSSPTDIQPAFQTILANALRLCRSDRGALFTFDGRLIDIGAFANVSAQGVAGHRRRFPRPADRSTATGRAVLTGAVVEIPDVLADPEYTL